ncbi:hypothetical protein F6U93_06780 [Tamlana haliotis]|uniref:EF-hand domain-containing protein n=1 Tax=Pseudotamlana haliotis TaxID=2614804 RepID=A0A6N6MHF0_9FLAO|nr:hypothetical protein [Tamlana haliotis]KAB1068400.1 hypothetical protein F6U93_06780 [Tamlana haliotis]
MRVEYPIIPSYGNHPDEIEKEKTNAYHFGHNNRNGFFPLGINNSWHGGIHIEGLGTKVCAIADGRIIAYRFAEDYLPEKDSETAKYSNSFMLIQHDFETPEKIKFRFYSLYMHLQPKKEMVASKDGQNIPDLYAKYVVKIKTNSREMGLKVREYKSEVLEKQKKETHFFAKGTTLKMEYDVCLPPEHWMCGNASYVFCSHNNKVFCVYKGYLTDEVDEFVKVDHYKAKEVNVFGEADYKGTMLFDAVNGNFVGMECYNTELEIEKTKDKAWYKVKGTDHYVLAQDCSKIFKKIKDDVFFKTVENVDVPIKAGQIIGNLGQYNSENCKSYNALHLEVFTDDANLSEFINNTKDKDRITYEVDKGKKLHKGKPCDLLLTNTNVKIFECDGDYTQIGFEDETAVVPYVILNDENKKIKTYVNGVKVRNNVYTIKEADFDEINSQLNHVLPNKQSEVYYINKTGADNVNRTIGYGMKYSGKKFWVKSIEVTGDSGAWVSLRAAINTVFENKPSNHSETVEVLKTSKIIKTAEAKDSQGVLWWHVKTKQEAGWIKKSELTEKNPYNWTDFGWKLLDDTGDQYFYMFGEFVEKSSPHKFVEDIWTQADTDGDKVLSNFELQQVMRNKASLHHVSKLICKHESEWNTWKNIDIFERELKSLFQKGIDEASDPERKQELETQRDKKIKVITNKTGNLCFWDEITTGDLRSKEERKQTYIAAHRKYTPVIRITDNLTVEEQGLAYDFEILDKKRIKRQFPKESNVYHFHPIAFVEQMKMIVGVNITTYFIFYNGNIEKHLSSSLEVNKYKYVYVDDKGSHHEICTTEFFVIKKKKYGVVHYSKPTHAAIIYDENVSEGSTSRRVKYVNNDIAEYGEHPTKGKIWRLYEALDEDVEIVKMPDNLNYSKNGVIIKYQFTSTKRRFTGSGSLAGFIGALAEHQEGIKTTGSCFNEGSCFPSSKHVNGESVDTIYKWDQNKDQKIIDAMKKFHFNERLIGSKKYFENFNNASDGGSLHNSHLHSGEFDNNKIQIIK